MPQSEKRFRLADFNFGPSLSVEPIRDSQLQGAGRSKEWKEAERQLFGDHTPDASPHPQQG